MGAWSGAAMKLIACTALVAAVLLLMTAAAFATVTTNYDHEWHNEAVVVTFSGTDLDVSFDHWQFELPSFFSDPDTGWTDVVGNSQTFDPANYPEGIWRVDYRAVAADDTPLETGWFYIKFDISAPYTRVSGVTSTWRKPPVNLTFSAVDDCSGVQGTYVTLGDPYDLAGVTWLNNNKVFSVTKNGANTVSFYSFDNSVGWLDEYPNFETPKAVTVRVDNTRPVPYAYANVSARYGSTATLKYRVTEAFTPTCAIKIVIKKGTKIVRTLSLGQQPRNTGATAWRGAATKASLARGTYTWYVYATDLAGNTQSTVPYRTLRIY